MVYFVAVLLTSLLSLSALALRVADNIARTDHTIASTINAALRRLMVSRPFIVQYSEHSLRISAISQAPKLFLMLLIITWEHVLSTKKALLSIFDGRSANLIAAYHIDLRMVAFSAAVSLAALTSAELVFLMRFSRRSPLTAGMQLGLIVTLLCDITMRAAAVCVPASALGALAFPVITIALLLLHRRYSFQARQLRASDAQPDGIATYAEVFFDGLVGLCVPAVMRHDHAFYSADSEDKTGLTVGSRRHNSTTAKGRRAGEQRGNRPLAEARSSVSVGTRKAGSPNMRSPDARSQSPDERWRTPDARSQSPDERWRSPDARSRLEDAACAKDVGADSLRPAPAWGLMQIPMVEETIASSVVSLLLVFGGLWSGWPNAHLDTVFQANVVVVSVAAVVCRAALVFGCVLPVEANSYEDMFTFASRHLLTASRQIYPATATRALL